MKFRTCETCYYFQKESDPKGYCRWNEPEQKLGGGVRPKHELLHDIVEKSHSCNKYFWIPKNNRFWIGFTAIAKQFKLYRGLVALLAYCAKLCLDYFYGLFVAQ